MPLQKEVLWHREKRDGLLHAYRIRVLAAGMHFVRQMTLRMLQKARKEQTEWLWNPVYFHCSKYFWNK